MTGAELRPGLWRWTAFHPTWKREVGCVEVETSGGTVLIDPLLGEHEISEPSHVLITVHWHVRSTAEIAARWPDVRVWTTPRRGKPLRGHADVTDIFHPGDALPGGIEALPTAREAEVVFWLPEHRALVAGDVLLGAKDGGLRMCRQSWLQRGTTLDDLAASLEPLLALDAEMVLVSHGEPVVEGAKAALEVALRGRRYAGP